MSLTRRLVIGVTGATGAAYAVRLLERARDLPDVEIHLVISPAGVLNMGTRPNQKTLITTLADLPNAVHDEAIKGATLFVIGRVVSLAKDLSWFGEIPQG